MLNMTLTLKRPAVLQSTDDRSALRHLYPADAPALEYIAHTPGGMIRVAHAGVEWLMNPAATVELG